LMTGKAFAITRRCAILIGFKPPLHGKDWEWQHCVVVWYCCLLLTQSLFFSFSINKLLTRLLNPWRVIHMCFLFDRFWGFCFCQGVLEVIYK
jgi:hypothetical protein